MSSRHQRTRTILVLITMGGCFLLSGLLLRQGSGEPPRIPVSQAQVIPARQAKPGGGGRSVSGFSKKAEISKLVAVFAHPNGWRTETRKMGNYYQVRQDTYTKDNVPVEVRIFKMDKDGQLKNSMIYDGRQNPVSSTRYFYDPHSHQPLLEELYNKKGVLIRKLYYPGALKDPEFANRMVGFSFDPENPRAAPVEIEGPVQPVRPVSANGAEFMPEAGAGAGRAGVPPGEEKTASRSRLRTSGTHEFQPSALWERIVWFKKKS